MYKKIGIWATSALCTAFVISFATHFFVANAGDPAPLQDFCVGVNDPDSAVFVNGKFCKNPNDVTVDDFLHKGFNISGNTDNILGVNATLVDVNKFPAINTLGVALARIDYASLGLNTPHLHPRSSEIFAVLKGTLYVGIITTDYKFFDAVLKEGDMIVFPQGLIHFQLNIGDCDALAIASFGSQNPGRVNVAQGVFGTKPPIYDYVLTKGFQVDDRVIEELRSQFSPENLSVHTGRSIMKLFS